MLAFRWNGSRRSHLSSCHVMQRGHAPRKAWRQAARPGERGRSLPRRRVAAVWRGLPLWLARAGGRSQGA
ncbi:hypothetical protein ACFPRL_05155 [Pseudoclavibacter helvolus]